MVVNKEKCYKAKTLSNILEDDKVFLYFKFLLPVLEESHKLNIIFQGNNYDVGSAYNEYYFIIIGLARRLLKPLFLNITDS